MRANAARLLAVLVVWTLLSYALISMFSGTNVCGILNVTPPGEAYHPLTQAEMDAQTARCNRPNTTTLTIAAAGYVLIVAVGLVTISSRDKSWLSGDS
jgi:hypothetical protein